jgi:hypothetical protein
MKITLAGDIGEEYSLTGANDVAHRPPPMVVVCHRETPKPRCALHALPLN